MSWSVGGKISSSEGLNDLELPESAQSTEHKEQFEAAKEAAAHLINAGVLGEGEFFVSLSGHANPEHKPNPPGWSNDSITISLSQSTEQ